MKWSLFSLVAGALIMGNVLVHAQNLPNPSSLTVPTRIPDEALRTLDISPAQVSDLPTDVRQQLGRQNEALRNRVLGAAQADVAASRGGIQLPSSSPGSSDQLNNPTSGDQNNSSSTDDTNGQSPLALSRSYLASAHALNEANIAQNLSLATAADIRLWKGYYDAMYDKIQETKRSYERTRDAIRRYKTQLDGMLGQLPTTILSCS